MTLKHAKAVKALNRKMMGDEMIRRLVKFNAGALHFLTNYYQLCNNYDDLRPSDIRRQYRDSIRIAKTEKAPKMLEAIAFLEEIHPGIRKYRQK